MSSKKFFADMKRSYADVAIDSSNGIDTVTFLEATESLVRLFDELGTAFAPVKSDITGNIVKIRATFDEHPNNSKTLQALVKNEIALANSRGVDALLWLKRGLEFTSTALRRNLENKNEELNKSFTKAYGDTLSKHHSIFVRPIFSVAMKACPYRKDFYESLVSEGTSLEDTYALMEKWLSALENIVRILVAFYVELKLEA